MAFNTPWFNSQDQSFFNSLNKTKIPHLILTAETEDFDPAVEDGWKNEGFDCRYVPLLNGGKDYVNRMKQAGENCGVGEYYAFVAYGEAASLALEAFRQPTTPRLCAIVAYYPSTIPQPTGTRYPPSIQILVHLAGTTVNVARNTEVLGIQGKRKSVPKNVGTGSGHGGIIAGLTYPVYAYPGRESGFAESDLDEYDPVAAGLAFGRSLGTLKRAFRMETALQIETARDHFVDASVSAATNPQNLSKLLANQSEVLHLPTLTGGTTGPELEKFYTSLFAPLPPSFVSHLISRTIGTNSRIVDELVITFTHSQPMPWLLPGIPSTGRKLEIALCSVVRISPVTGQLESEHVYWDQASVLVQLGLLDGNNAVPGHFKKKGVKKLPIVGVEAARALMKRVKGA
ncbi:hypothetical protein K431DRAFT_255005 [Polychaeton citri CBS 116435]|uniref:Dienelactone hydrolase n=1 Tax=Polychaeton citri CBS 116435 TaxID=1314669 RepID=A0A9P4Q1G3_9PEZI|nr:hypothetical protein K431DRAFT_255005 [Polychaeton citri CBS 116435]